MSQWTHINAAIRFDGIPGLGNAEPKLGNTCNYESEKDKWDACDVPCGSEGSLQYSVVIAGTGLVYKSVHIWGDLRDYDDVNEIREYLTRVVDGKCIRSGVAHIDMEGQPPLILLCNEENYWVNAELIA